MKFYRSESTKAANLPFSDAIRLGDVLYLSGQLGNVPGTLELVPGGIEPESRQMMENISHILKSNRRSFDDVFKCTVMLADMANWAKFNSIYASYFKPDRLPVRSAFGTGGLALGAAVEMECWAWAPDEVQAPSCE